MTHVTEIQSLFDKGRMLSATEALTLAEVTDTQQLTEIAGQIRDQGHGSIFSYSRKVFIPLTHLCRDVCHYCTFAQVPSQIKGALKAPYLSVEEALEIARQGAQSGCKEALFTLGDMPEARYKVARQWLQEHGYATTLDYLAHVAQEVFQQTGLLPHLNPGLMSLESLLALKKVSVSMGIMLESSSDRLTQKGMPHYGSPDKIPARRIETIRLAGEAGIPFTSGILIGIGETRLERIESLLVLRDLHQQYGHLQEIIIQNFRAKANTLMVNAPEPDLNELIWTIAVARIIFGPEMNLQAPPNLSPGVLPQLVNAGINDWGGVSPVTPDFVNPEAPWPHLDNLARETQKAGKQLIERLAIYPDYALNAAQWTDSNFTPATLQAIDGQGFARVDHWYAGVTQTPPKADLALIQGSHKEASRTIKQILDPLIDDSNQSPNANSVNHRKELSEQEIVTLMQARGADFTYLCKAADKVRRQENQDTVTYVVNRNINYTNICYFKCQFCAFSKGKTSENLRGKPYDLSLEEIQRRCVEAWQRGATEVCLQGGIHPSYTGQTYLDICKAIKAACPELHIHAFSPLEVWQGAKTLGITLEQFLIQLKAAGLDTLPGTAAEILDDEVRKDLCPDKINTQQWQEVMTTAHRVGFKTTATIMFGHIERYAHLARHLLLIRKIQQTHVENFQAQNTQANPLGFTEFVLLPFVHMEAPMHRKGKSRSGPTFRESVALHAISRLVLSPYITNIQASWTKMGHEGAAACLNAGVNDLGGTLMNETITRSAGASHGQETSPASMEQIIRQSNRVPKQRGTYYQQALNSQVDQSFQAQPLLEPILDAPLKVSKGASNNSIQIKAGTQRIHCVDESIDENNDKNNDKVNDAETTKNQTATMPLNSEELNPNTITH